MRRFLGNDLCLIISDEIEEFEPRLNFDISMCKYTYRLFVEGNIVKSFNKQYINECINEYIESINDSQSFVDDEKEIKTRDESIKYIKQFIDKPLDLINKAEFIELSLSNSKIKRLLKNDLFKNKKIILDCNLNASDYNQVKKLYEEFKYYQNQVYICLEGNEDYVTIADAMNALEKIKEEAEIIKKLNLSPMESIMVAYDMVRDRQYIEDESSYNTSRDLCSILKQDAIVCLGYSNHLNAILTYLGINCNELSLEKPNSNIGHSRCIINVVDPKYNINGIYCFDPTWESKKEDNNFLYQYNFFAKTIDQFKEYENSKYTHIYSDYKQALNLTIKCYEKKDYETLRKNAISINRISSMANNGLLVDRLKLFPMSPAFETYDLNDIRLRAIKTLKKFNNPIPAETFIKLINNVRKVEYYSNPEKFDYDIDTLYTIFLNSGWKFAKDLETDQKRLLELIFGSIQDKEEDTEKENEKYFIKFCNKEGIFKIVNGVRLTKTLQTIAKQKEKQL